MPPGEDAPFLRGFLPTKHALAGTTFAYVVFLHFVGLSLFTRGFLLTRLALPTKTMCDPPTLCTLPATHKRAVLLIIDALRFDFVAPNPPAPKSPYYHDVLTLPRELTSSHPLNSFLFDAYSDPPTATLQRIKGITTGSLPTFVDIGSSFSAAAIEEDSIISQLRAAGKTIAFAGDDTWMTVFAKPFTENMSFPYDSFNVEDLHSVDEGVIRHMFPLLENKESKWDFFIGHFLGVDHVGHRLGPDHPTMRTKLKQMDIVLRQVVNALDEDTLLVVLGDHGMDAKGDHGGDGTLETSSALWIYSKGHPLSTNSPLADSESIQTSSIFPGASESHRSIQQIDLVPTLSLLLGLPIPFNNLGSVIPEVFHRPLPGASRWLASESTLSIAMRINAEQIMAYLRAYRSSSSGSELDTAWSGIESAFAKIGHDMYSKFAFTRLALSECRALWAQFNAPLMNLGLIVLFVALPTLGAVYASLASKRDQWEVVSQALLVAGWGGALCGAFLGLVVRWTEIGQLDIALGCAALTSELLVIATNWQGVLRIWRYSLYTVSRGSTIIPLIIMGLHSVAFTSNSFTMWEDRIVPLLLITLLFPVVISSFSYPSSSHRRRTIGYTLASAVCVRLMAVSTVCREEQQPYCSVTFYASATRPRSPLAVVLAILPLALALPTLVRSWFLGKSKSDKGAAPFFIDVVWRVSLVGGSTYWLVEWFESVMGQPDGDGTVGFAVPSWMAAALVGRTILARIVLGGTLVGMYVFWWNAPLNIEIIVAEPLSPTDKRRVTVIGFANAYGSLYLLFLLPFFALLWASTQLSGQLVLAFGFAALLCFVEAVDAQRDARSLNASFAAGTTPEAALDNFSSVGVVDDHARSPTFAEAAFLSLLGHHLFFSTGHQAVLSSIQWKSAFVGFPILVYPWSPALVSLNTFGGFGLAAMAVPLFATWAIPPVQRGRVNVLSDSLRLSLGMQLYLTALLVGSAGAAALLRRHLMVWKVFAPRFMLAGVVLLCVDVILALAVFIGSARVVSKVRRVFGTDV